MTGKPPSRWWGALAFVFYAAHVALHWRLGHPERFLWACHLSNVAIGLGFLTRSAWLNGVGFLWLTIGIPLWLVYLSRGGILFVTSPLTHLGGLAIAVYGLRRLGVPKHLWLATLAASFTLHQICRQTTPPEESVNLAWDIWAGGGEAVFSSYLAYVTTLVVLSAMVFFLAEQGARKAFAPVSPPTGR